MVTLHLEKNAHFIQAAILALIVGISFAQCKRNIETPVEPVSQINSKHLDALYVEKKVGDDSVGIIHIYSEFPDYHLVGDEDEGNACVDDASRAAIFYIRQYQKDKNPEHLRKGKMLMKFLAAMQAPNGYYYNFLWPDGKIHIDGTTSKPEPNFWSWRTLWAIGEAIEVLEKNDSLTIQIKSQRERLVRNILNEPSFNTSATDTTMGWTFPTWLPKVSGTDQAAIILTGLSLMLKQQETNEGVNRDSIQSLMRHFAEGIQMMQIKEAGSKYEGAFLSWENLWHAYANIQSYGLMMAGQTLNDSNMIHAGRYEIDHFYPTIIQHGFLHHFMVKKQNEQLTTYDENTFSQIAYGIRPMVWGALKAFDITNDQKYLETAKDLASWFFGNNPAKATMYDPATGRGYDGISSSDQINKNAGAESTIEALLTLQAMEQYTLQR